MNERKQIKESVDLLRHHCQLQRKSRNNTNYYIELIPGFQLTYQYTNGWWSISKGTMTSYLDEHGFIDFLYTLYQIGEFHPILIEQYLVENIL